MEIKLKIDAPELAQALFSLAQALQTNTELVLQTYQRPDMMAQTVAKAEPAETPVPTVEPNSTPAITLQELRAKMADLGKAGKQGQIKDAMAKYGANKLTEVPQECYEQLWAEVGAM